MTIDWTESALADLIDVKAYIGKDSEYYGEQFIDWLISSVESLSDFPKLGRTIPELEMDTFREIIFHNYKIMYRTKKDCVSIFAIVHCKRLINEKIRKSWEIA
ncbi:MAG: type II toxin-antitoxin system RelE/ParE family toxin [Nitrospinae bacterium]|nr:type II toxin-antitoxin system RelE/ParE family toxin [Nitrospinota bacterium]